MDKVLETHKLPKLAQEETNFYRPTTNKDIKSVIKIFQQRKSQDQMASLVNPTVFKEELTTTIGLPWWRSG